ncbi:MAG TPA: histidine--tRNA ligase [Candidatus Saccharimonadales bacterium]|nr:histidine--tRNA ligase [Candidatus Saccharimonadales bacterium]
MSLSTQPYKGARDFYPEDKRLQKYLFRVMRESVERMGYEEYDAPILESFDIYLAKTGEEIVNEQTYAFEDRGGRKVAIRPEMTPTVSRMVAARRQELAYPLRWYSIPNLWRYERPQRGRLREHWQLNVDLFGVGDTRAEIEIIQTADAIMKGFGATHDMYQIKLNSRKFMDHIMSDYLGLNATQAHTLAKLIDRMHKMPLEEFEAEAEAILAPSQRDAGATNKLHGLLKTKTLEHLPEVLRAHPSVKELQNLMQALRDNNVTNVVFDITLMRGFDYYTDIVFEVFDKHPENNRSLFGGGRYDGLVGLFGVEPVPTVGFGMGDVTLQNFLEVHDLMPTLRSETDVYVVLIGDVYDKAQRVIREMRTMGLNIAVDFTGRKPDKQIKTASKKDIHYVCFIGEKELEEELYTLRNLHTGVEEKHSASRIVSIARDYRGEKDDL